MSHCFHQSNSKSSRNVCIILIRQLALGGLEKSALNLREQLDKDFNVFIVSLFPPSPSARILVSSETNCIVAMNTSDHQLSFINLFRAIYCLVFAIKSLCDQQSFLSSKFLVVSFGAKENILSVLSSYILRLFFRFNLFTCVSERNHPAFKKFSSPVRLLRFLLYPLASCVHVQTMSAKAWFLSHNSRLKNKIFVIPNTCDFSPHQRSCLESDSRDHFDVLLVGNKFHQKGFDLLADHSSTIAQSFNSNISNPKSLRFNVFGSVLDSIRPKAFAPQLLNSPTVLFHGAHSLDHIYSFSYGCFLLLSRYEGYPNVLLEAINNNLIPCVFDNGYGVDEIVGASYPFMFSTFDPERIGFMLAQIYSLSSSSRIEILSDLKSRLARCSTESTSNAWRQMISSCLG